MSTRESGHDSRASLPNTLRLIIALGGNALLLRGERPDASIQLTHVELGRVSYWAAEPQDDAA